MLSRFAMKNYGWKIYFVEVYYVQLDWKFVGQKRKHCQWPTMTWKEPRFKVASLPLTVTLEENEFVDGLVILLIAGNTSHGVHRNERILSSRVLHRRSLLRTTNRRLVSRISSIHVAWERGAVQEQRRHHKVQDQIQTRRRIDEFMQGFREIASAEGSV